MKRNAIGADGRLSDFRRAVADASNVAFVAESVGSNCGYDDNVSARASVGTVSNPHPPHLPYTVDTAGASLLTPDWLVTQEFPESLFGDGRHNQVTMMR